MQFAQQMPQYGAPQQQFGAPQQMPQQVAAPQVQYGAPAPQQYAAPQQMQYAPQPTMQYAAPQPQVQYAAPAPTQMQYAAPQVQQYAAPAMQPKVVYNQKHEENSEMLQVTVFGTKQLPGAQNPQVDIEIAGKPHKHTVESHAIEGPEMKPKSLITYYLPGEHLNFTVSEAGNLLGDVQISGQDFHPNGLEGDLPLMDPTTGAQGSGYLMVRIVPLGMNGQPVELPPVEIKGEAHMAPDPAPYVVGQSAPRACSPEEYQQLGQQGAMLVTPEDQMFQQPVMSQPQPQPVYAAPQPQPMYAAPQPQPVYGAPQPQPMYAQAQPQPMYAQPQQQPMYAQPMPTQAPGVYQPQQMAPAQPGFSMPFPGSAARP